MVNIKINKKKKLILIGNSGHAKVVANIIIENNEYEIIGCISNNKNPLIIGNITIPYIGNDNELEKIYKQGIKYSFIAIGDNKTREKLYKKIKAIGYNLIQVISKNSYIANSVKIGDGTVIMSGVSIQPMTKIEENVIINTNASIDHDCYIQKHVHIGPGCNLAGNVIVEAGVFLGIGTKIIPQKKIGSWSMVGAGGVVIKDIPPKTTAVGIPAKVIKNL